MRLIQVETLRFVETFSPKDKRYAILSHAWHEGQEVSFQEWQKWLAKEPGWEEVENKSGHAKIIEACRKAKEYKLDYIWIDTNCIDKTSSAELSEAINSMFSWYSWSVVCFAYLSDFAFWEGISASEILRQLEDSKWFTRGWTLQELLAPKNVEFFSQGWRFVGTRTSLARVVEYITGIGVAYLEGPGRGRDISSASVAMRMSWAARRRTSRVEDMAYSLLGLFDINMPLLYGEGEKAFLRLQEEIIKVSADQSIFAWEFVPEVQWASPDHFKPHQAWVSVLAPLPICFRSSGSVVFLEKLNPNSRLERYTLTNIGLQIHLPLLATSSTRLFFAVLRATEADDNHLLAIPLIRVHDSFTRRMWPSKAIPLCHVGCQPSPIEILIPRQERIGHREDVWEIPFFAKTPEFLVLILLCIPDMQLERWSTTDEALLQPDFGILEVHRRQMFREYECAVLEFSRKGGKPKFTMMVGIDFREAMMFQPRLLRGKIWDREDDGMARSLMNLDLENFWGHGFMEDVLWSEKTPKEHISKDLTQIVDDAGLLEGIYRWPSKTTNLGDGLSLLYFLVRLPK